uniref:Uncharacterized protein n=1 Tax=Pithovirus LCPAC302 TaxID=2506593 RepID=A0A481Z6N2_9VIRU|nr:MAG: uncharacterized protein LCPAC302_00470 [Pithovirus LCPAC302]
MLPQTLENVGMEVGDIILTNGALIEITNSDKEGGLRTIEKIVKSLVGKINMYRRIVLDDETTGDFNLSYYIPNFKLPLKIGTKLIRELNIFQLN